MPKKAARARTDSRAFFSARDAAASILSMIACRRAWRSASASAADPTNQSMVSTTPSGVLPRLLRGARRRGQHLVNDCLPPRMALGISFSGRSNEPVDGLDDLIRRVPCAGREQVKRLGLPDAEETASAARG